MTRIEKDALKALAVLAGFIVAVAALVGVAGSYLLDWLLHRHRNG